MIAFGGNALLRAGGPTSFEAQCSNVESTCEQLIPLIKRGYDIVIGHGNGPQVGNALLRHEAGKQVFVRGNGKLRTYQDNNNHVTRATCDVRVSEIQLCGTKKEETNDDRPF